MLPYIAIHGSYGYVKYQESNMAPEKNWSTKEDDWTSSLLKTTMIVFQASTKKTLGRTWVLAAIELRAPTSKSSYKIRKTKLDVQAMSLPSKKTQGKPIDIVTSGLVVS